ncbi:MAG: zinc-binding dehydrogenase [Deltaproteobacteria bacterium]|nr:zinc-binding dehydrogenase [Deltaproteobacteria bacterium]
MRAAIMRDQRIVTDELPDPIPKEGQVLVKTLACGVCGSDLHYLQNAHRMGELGAAMGRLPDADPNADLVMGHEFCAEIVEFGPCTERKLNVGDRVCSMPMLVHPGGIAPVGYSAQFPGGYGELMLLSEPMLLRVSDDLPTEAATLTEPMAVGLHAVRKGNLQSTDAPLVLGCGPVGLAVIAALRLQGVEPIVASDFSATRRELARTMGADVVVNPAEEPAMERLVKEAGLKAAVVFECVGVPGMLQDVILHAPHSTRFIVVGVCMEEDRIQPLLAISKELAFQFVLGYTPEEFAETLRALTEGSLDGKPMISGRIGVDGVAGAFEALGQPDAHAKVLVEPWRNGLL